MKGEASHQWGKNIYHKLSVWRKPAKKEKKNGEVICQSSMEENQAAPTDDGPKTMLNAATRTN